MASMISFTALGKTPSLGGLQEAQKDRERERERERES
jgi:hypothetical protein